MKMMGVRRKGRQKRREDETTKEGREGRKGESKEGKEDEKKGRVEEQCVKNVESIYQASGELLCEATNHDWIGIENYNRIDINSSGKKKS